MVALLRDVTQKEMWVSCLLVALASFASLTKDELLTCFEPLQRLLPKLLTVEKDSEPLKKLLRRCLNEKYPFEADPEMIERHYAEIKAVSPLFKLCEPVYPVILNRSMTAKRATFVLMQEEDWSAENSLLTAALVFFGNNPEAVTKQVLTRVMSKAEFLPSDVVSTPSACNAAADILSKSLVAVKGAKEYTENVMAVVIKKISPLHYSRELATRLNDGIVLRALQRGVEEKNVCFVNAAIRYLGAMSSQSFEAIKPLYIDQWLDKARSSQLPVHPDFLAGLGETMRLHHAALAKKNIEHNVKMGYPKFQIGKACDWHAGVKEHRAIFERAIRLTENWRRWSTKELGSRGENDFYHYFSETLSPLGALCLCEIALNGDDLELLQIALRVITPLLKNGSAQAYALVVLKLLSNPSDTLVASLQKDSSMMGTVLASCMSLCFDRDCDQRVKTTGEKFIKLAKLLKTFSEGQFEEVMKGCLTVEFAREYLGSAQIDRDTEFFRVVLVLRDKIDEYPQFQYLWALLKFVETAQKHGWYTAAYHLSYHYPQSRAFKQISRAQDMTEVKAQYKDCLNLDEASLRALQRYLIDVFFGRAAHAVNGDISEPVAILKRIFGDPLPLR